MSRRFGSREALADKIEREGGVLEALGYGIKAEEMPDDELVALWTDLQTKYKAADTAAGEAARKISDLLDGHEEQTP